MTTLNLLPAGSAAAMSAVQTLAAGQTLTLVGAGRPAGGASYWRAQVQRQMSDGAWETIATLSWQRPTLTIFGEGSYRVQREAGSGCLVDGALA